MNRIFFLILLLLVSVFITFGSPISASSMDNWLNMGIGGGAKIGETVTMTYVCRLDDGTVYDSAEVDEPYILKLGEGKALIEFENNIIGLSIGETKKFLLKPDQAYGYYDPSLIVDMPLSFVPPGENASVGDIVTLHDGEKLFKAKILQITDKNIQFDCNNILAGEYLNYEVTILNIE